MKKIKFNLNDTKNVIEELKDVNCRYASLKINLIKKKNLLNFFKMQARLQKETPNLFPIELKLDRELDSTAIFYIN